MEDYQQLERCELTLALTKSGRKDKDKERSKENAYGKRLKQIKEKEEEKQESAKKLCIDVEEKINPSKERKFYIDGPFKVLIYGPEDMEEVKRLYGDIR